MKKQYYLRQTRVHCTKTIKLFSPKHFLCIMSVWKGLIQCNYNVLINKPETQNLSVVKFVLLIINWAHNLQMGASSYRF